MVQPSKVRKIAFVGDHLPRKCGIATFTSDLLSAVATAHPQSQCLCVSVNDIKGGYDYPEVVRFEIEEQDLSSYLRAADFLNISNVDIVCLQHEFGIYGGPAGSHILAFLRELRMPVVTTLHTVLREPRADPVSYTHLAAEERRMAAANEQIGIAQAAFYPTVSLSALLGLQSTSPVSWLTWPSRLWAVGPALSQTLFDHGLRQGNSEIARSNYDATVAAYRQSALAAFQEVEDNLAALRELETEAQQQHVATESAEQSLDLFKTRYEGGVDTYLQVVTWQTAALQNERNDIDIMRRRLEADVLLIKALGGGWNVSNLPQVQALR